MGAVLIRGKGQDCQAVSIAAYAGGSPRWSVQQSRAEGVHAEGEIAVLFRTCLRSSERRV